MEVKKIIDFEEIFSESVNADGRLNPIADGQSVVYEFPVEVISTGVRTANGNMYPMDVVRKGVENDLRTQRALKNSGIPCEADHYIIKSANGLNDPAEYKRYTRVNMSEATHVIKELYWKDTRLFARIRTIAGSKLTKWIDSGEVPMFSLRSVGRSKINKDGTKDAASFRLISLDWVDANSNEGSVPDPEDIKRINPVGGYRNYQPLKVASGGMTESIERDGVKMNSIIQDGRGHVVGLANIEWGSKSLKEENLDMLYEGL